jgi:hypothetical protein
VGFASATGAVVVGVSGVGVCDERSTSLADVGVAPRGFAGRDDGGPARLRAADFTRVANDFFGNAC